MEINQKKDQIQNEAVEAWKNNNKQGVVEIITGFGKTFLALKALYTMPRNKDVLHLFLAEQVDREIDLEKDIIKFNKINNCNVHEDYNLKFHCYQTVRNWRNYKLGLVIADEIPDSISPENYKFYLNNRYDALIGLTALFKGDTVYYIKEEHIIRNTFDCDIISKKELLDHIAPICFSYNVNQGQIDGTSRKLNIFIIESELDNNNKNILAGNAKNKFYQTEAGSYGYLNKLYENTNSLEQGLLEDFYKFQERKNLQMFSIINRRSKFLYNLPSKIVLVKKLLNDIKDKTVIFSNSLESLKEVTPNIVSSKNSDDVNTRLRESFDKGLIRVIGSFKKLVQGANLNNVDNCIIMSYYGKEIKLIQMIGRLRQNGDKDGNVFIFVTKDTQEEVWLTNMMVGINNYNIFRGNYEDCLKQYNNEKHTFITNR